IPPVASVHVAGFGSSAALARAVLGFGGLRLAGSVYRSKCPKWRSLAEIVPLIVSPWLKSLQSPPLAIATLASGFVLSSWMRCTPVEPIGLKAESTASSHSSQTSSPRLAVNHQPSML